MNREKFININIRDEIIKVAIENHLKIHEIQKLLIFSEKEKLYPRFKRDAIIIHGILNDKSVKEINIELEKFHQIKL